MKASSLALVPLVAVLLVGCSSGVDQDDSPTQAEVATENDSDKYRASDEQSELPPLGITDDDISSIKNTFPGYPVLVDVDSIDSRVSSNFEGRTSDNKVVALTPGVYTAYNSSFSNLDDYYKSGVVSGDTMMINKFFPNIGSTAWSGVQPGPQEPRK